MKSFACSRDSWKFHLFQQMNSEVSSPTYPADFGSNKMPFWAQKHCKMLEWAHSFVYFAYTNGRIDHQHLGRLSLLLLVITGEDFCSNFGRSTTITATWMRSSSLLLAEQVGRLPLLMNEEGLASMGWLEADSVVAVDRCCSAEHYLLENLSLLWITASSPSMRYSNYWWRRFNLKTTSFYPKSSSFSSELSWICSLCDCRSFQAQTWRFQTTCCRIACALQWWHGPLPLSICFSWWLDSGDYATARDTTFQFFREELRQCSSSSLPQTSGRCQRAWRLPRGSMDPWPSLDWEPSATCAGTAHQSCAGGVVQSSSNSWLHTRWLAQWAFCLHLRSSIFCCSADFVGSDSFASSELSAILRLAGLPMTVAFRLHLLRRALAARVAESNFVQN